MSGSIDFVVNGRPVSVTCDGTAPLLSILRDELALRFTLSVPGVSSAIAGSRGLAHLRENIAIAAKGPLPRDVYERIRDAFRPHDWEGKI